MKVWYDACTGKHTRYGAVIGRRLRASGHEYIFTTRAHPDTLPLAKILGEKPLVVGKYSPSTLAARLEESSERIIAFSKMFKDNKPDAAIAHQSVELCRTAFGLGIPIILTADTPHALAVNRLTIPFAHTVVVSEALPKSFTQTYCAQRVVPFKGVDEVAWIKGFKPKKIPSLKKPLIVLRQIETKAAYAKGKADTAKTLAEQLSELGHVHLVERYNGEGETCGVKPEFEDTAAGGSKDRASPTSPGVRPFWSQPRPGCRWKPPRRSRFSRVLHTVWCSGQKPKTGTVRLTLRTLESPARSKSA